MKTLEILIPTYGRPASAASAIDSCLAISDARLGIRCSSNCFEQSLEKYRTLDSRLTYSCFETNQGPHKNFLHLLKSSESRFCMLLSDEDRIEPTGLKAFLDFLDACNEQVGVISCSIFDVVEDRYFHHPQGKISRIWLDGNVFAALSLAPTYMSGLCFSRKGLYAIDLDSYFHSIGANAYPHIDIAQNILLKMYFGYYLPRLVLKGKEVKVGGDGYTHRKIYETTSDTNLDLNPSVYGPNARARQFFYRENLMTRIKQELRPIPYLLGKMSIYLFFLEAMLRSPEVVRLSPGTNLQEEARKSLAVARAQGEFSGSLIARAFLPCLGLPFFTRRIFGISLAFFHKILRKLFKISVQLRGGARLSSSD